MGLGIKSFVKRVIDYSKKREIVPICQKIDSNKLLDGKIAFITGGSGGIGMAIAKKYIESGCKVIISGTNEVKLKRCILELGEESAYVQLDLNNVASFSEKYIEASEKFGTIDILVNCAGMHIVRNNLSFINSTEEEYDKIMNLNLKGTYFWSQCFAKDLISKHKHGHILMISSQSGLEPAWSPYRLSKWGLNGMTKGLAQSLLPHDIIVNGIGPGPTATSMQPYTDGDGIYTNLNPINRYTMPEEIAEYALLLVSSLGDTIVGDTIYMSGGRGIIELR